MRVFFSIILTMILVAIFTNTSFAQNPIPNPGFENWTAGYPDQWVTADVPNVYTTITQSNIRHSGNYAVKGMVTNYAQVNVPPLLTAGSSLIEISQNYTRLTGYYQMDNKGEDAMYVEVFLYDTQPNLVAGGIAELAATNGGYQMFTVDLEYVFGNQNTAAAAYILFTIGTSSTASGEDITLGSSFLVDDLAFDMASSVGDQRVNSTPYIFTLAQNYPNPFNPSTTIVFSLPSSGKTLLTVYNNLGQMVERLIDEDLAEGVHQVTFNASNLPSGTYFYKLEAGSRSTVKRMMLVK